MPRLSVITPFHNTTEDLFQACADSVLSQGMSDFEWIIIDDGSEEKYAEFLKDFCEKDSRIRFIRQEACGVSVARNRGLEEKTGDFFTFVDSDDIISPNFFEEALEVATRTQADIVYGILSDTASPLLPSDFSDIPERIYQGQDKDLLLRSVVSGKDLVGGTDVSIFRPFAIAPRLYRSATFSDLCFETSMTLGEDSLFNACTIDAADTVVFSPQLWYTYIIHDASSVYSYLSHDHALAMLSSFNRYGEVAKEKSWNDSDIGMRFLHSFLHILNLYIIQASTFHTYRLIKEITCFPVAQAVSAINLSSYRIDGHAHKMALQSSIIALRHNCSFPIAFLTKIRRIVKNR